MENSILNDVKALLGLHADYTPFDKEIILYINTALNVLYQVGVGDPVTYISSAENTWDEVVGSAKDLEMVKLYIYLRTKLQFDPTASATIQENIKETLKELEWRINSAADIEQLPDDEDRDL